MIQLYVGTIHQLNAPLKVSVEGTQKEAKAILPLCMAKFDLLHEQGILKVVAIEENPSTPVGPISKIVYDLENFVDEEGTLIIRPKRDYIFNHFVNNDITEEKARTAFEHIDDLQMDLTLKIADALVLNGTLILTEKEKASFEQLKTQFNETTSVTLESATYEINYAFNGDGSSKANPLGLKRIARANTENYKNILQYFRFLF